MRKGLVSVVIVTMNNKQWLKKSICALQKQTYKAIEILVVDNGSIDGTESFIRKMFPKVSCIRSEKNLGFGRAANKAIRKTKGEYVLIYNDDALCAKDFLTILVKTLEQHQELDGCQGKLVSYAAPHHLQSCGSYLTPFGVLIKNTNSKKFSFVFNANLPLLRTKAVKKAGMFDEDYFLYFEETDLCWRIALQGGALAYVPEAVVLHVGGETVKKLPSPLVIQSTFQNRCNSLIKNLEIGSFFYVMPLHLLFCIGVGSVYLLCGKQSLALAVGKGIVQNLTDLPKTLQKRKQIQQHRVISDRILFRSFLRPMTLAYLWQEGKNSLQQWK